MSNLIKLALKGTDIPSAATIELPDDGDRFDVTGTTAISSIQTNGRGIGARFYLRFTGALTLTHGSNLSLHGADNYATTAGDLLQFEVAGDDEVRQIYLANSGTGGGGGTGNLKADGSTPFTGNQDANGHTILNLATPSGPGDAVTKDYADAIAVGLKLKANVRVSTYANDASNGSLPTHTRSGNVLTASANGSLNALNGGQGIDGVNTLESGDSIFVRHEGANSGLTGDPAENGIYLITDVGSESTPWTLTRRDDCDSDDEIQGAYALVEEGGSRGGKMFALIFTDTITLNTTPLTFTRFGASGPAGPGVPAGGTTGQVLAKASGADFDTEWVEQSSGGGGVNTVAEIDVSEVTSPYELTSAEQAATTLRFMGTSGSALHVSSPTSNNWVIHNASEQTVFLLAASGSDLSAEVVPGAVQQVYTDLNSVWYSALFTKRGSIPLDGLVVWLSASTITGVADGDPVATWPDKSPNGNHATQATSSHQPTYAASLTGTPSVRFDGSDDEMLLGDLSSFFPSAATLIVVASACSPSYAIYASHLWSTVQQFWHYLDNDNGYFGPFRSARINNYPSATPTSGNHVWKIFSDGSSYEVVIDGTSGGAQAASFEAGTSHVVGSANGFLYLNGDVFEVIAYDHRLSDDEMSVVDDYISAKYGL